MLRESAGEGDVSSSWRIADRRGRTRGVQSLVSGRNRASRRLDNDPITIADMRYRKQIGKEKELMSNLSLEERCGLLRCKIDAVIRELRTTSFYRALVDEVTMAMSHHPVYALICLGIGSFSCNRSSLAQLSLALLLRETLSLEDEFLYFFDPVFDETDCRFLSTQFSVDVSDPATFRSRHAGIPMFLGDGVLDTSASLLNNSSPQGIVYWMPHCERVLYDQLFQVHQSDDIRICIVGNLLDKYEWRVGSSKLNTETPTLAQILPRLHCRSLPVPPEFCEEAFLELGVCSVASPSSPSTGTSSSSSSKINSLHPELGKKSARRKDPSHEKSLLSVMNDVDSTRLQSVPRSFSPLVIRLGEKGPLIVREVFLESGWMEYNESIHGEYRWDLWWKNSRFAVQQTDRCRSHQKINHFPRSSEMTKKDTLVRLIRRHHGAFGSLYDFIPETYILPSEFVKFALRFAEDNASGKKNSWICKPSDLSRGRKIFLFNDISDLNYDAQYVVQQYIENPLLIGGYKFDLRIYVLVTSYHPLQIFIYREGLARFSTEKYETGSLENKFVHLTNASINKVGPSYHLDKETIGEGSKWTISRLRQYIRESMGLCDHLLWFRIREIIILTVCATASVVPRSTKCCFELYGFDVLVDDLLRPWLIEVNFSPALGVDCDIDRQVKEPLIRDVLSILHFSSDASRFDDGDSTETSSDKTKQKFRNRESKRSSLAKSSSSRCSSEVYSSPEDEVSRSADHKRAPSSDITSAYSVDSLGSLCVEDERGSDLLFTESSYCPSYVSSLNLGNFSSVFPFSRETDLIADDLYEKCPQRDRAVKLVVQQLRNLRRVQAQPLSPDHTHTSSRRDLTSSEKNS